MADDVFDLEIEIDARELLRDLEEVDKKRQEVEEKAANTISFINEGTKEAYYEGLERARAVWLTTRGVLKAGGASISSYFNLLIHTTFRTIEILTPLLTAKGAASFWADPTVIIGLTNLGIATAAAIAAQLEYEGLASQLHGATTALRGLTYLFGQNY